MAITTRVFRTKNTTISRGRTRSTRACSSPSVLSDRKIAPWVANIATAVTPTSRANGVSRSVSEALMLPSASIGTPLRTLPKATPRSSANPTEAAQKTVSQADRQRGECSLLRNSMATVRRIITSSTSMNAR